MQTNSQNEPSSSGFRTLAIISLLVAVCALAYWFKSRSAASRSAKETSPPVVESTEKRVSPPRVVTAPPVEPDKPVPPEISPAPSVPAPASQPSVTRPAIVAETKPPRPEPSGYTRQLVTSLAQIDPKTGLTPEQAAQWKESMGKLVREGAGSVPAIREFLERNMDMALNAVPGGEQLGQASLRTALFDALQQIGGPEAQGLMADTLRTSAVPSELALLAKMLEQQAPEQYRQTAVQAARDLLAEATQGKLDQRDVGPLFDIMRNYGDASLAPELEKAVGQWNYYAAMTLAEMPNGAGIPSLIQMAETGTGRGRTVVWQMLAQASLQSPEALAALTQQARQGQIPPNAWSYIGSALKGDRLQFPNSVFESAPVPPTAPGLKTFHLALGNQNFYSVPYQGAWNPQLVNQLVTPVDHLLGATSDPAAVQALQEAKAYLNGQLVK